MVLLCMGAYLTPLPAKRAAGFCALHHRRCTAHRSGRFPPLPLPPSLPPTSATPIYPLPDGGALLLLPGAVPCLQPCVYPSRCAPLFTSAFRICFTPHLVYYALKLPTWFAYAPCIILLYLLLPAYSAGTRHLTPYRALYRRAGSRNAVLPGCCRPQRWFFAFARRGYLWLLPPSTRPHRS